MVAEQIRKAQTPSELIKLFQRNFSEEVLNAKPGIDSENFIYAFNAIPFELRSEIVYVELVKIFGTKIIYYIPQNYKNDFLCYVLEKEADSVAKTKDARLITFKHEKGSVVYLPLHKLYFCYATPEKVLKVYNDKKEFMNLDAAELKNDQLAEEYKALLLAKLEYEKTEKLNKAKKEGIIKDLKGYILSSQQGIFANKASKKIIKERENAETNDSLYVDGIEELKKLKAKFTDFKSKNDFVSEDVGAQVLYTYTPTRLRKMMWQNESLFVDIIENSKNIKLAKRNVLRWKYKQMRTVYSELKGYWEKLNGEYKITEKEFKKFKSLINSSLKKIEIVTQEVSDAIDSFYFVKSNAKM